MGDLRPEIAVVVYTKDDPIHVDTRRIAAVLDNAGYDSHIVDLDWASEPAWHRLMSPSPWDYGRHSINGREQRDYIVRRYLNTNEFVRDRGHGGDLETVV